MLLHSWVYALETEELTLKSVEQIKKNIVLRAAGDTIDLQKGDLQGFKK